MSSQSFLLFFTLPIIAKTTAVKIPISNPTKAASPPLEYLDNRTSNIMIFNLITNNINHYLFNPTLITITIKAMNINANAIVAILLPSSDTSYDIPILLPDNVELILIPFLCR